jgi:hypothetical protein
MVVPLVSATLRSEPGFPVEVDAWTRGPGVDCKFYFFRFPILTIVDTGRRVWVACSHFSLMQRGGCVRAKS